MPIARDAAVLHHHYAAPDTEHMQTIRPPAVAGTWYPGSAAALARAVDGHLASARAQDAAPFARLVALIAPHAGLEYSGPVAAHAYRLLDRHRFDVIVIVGPSHFVAFDGVALYPGAGFETPFGVVPVDQDCGAALVSATPVVRAFAAAHAREHSLEMQLPFIQHLAPAVPIVPLVIGSQTADVARSLGDALAATLRTRRALLVASTDLSHYQDAATAARLDGVVVDHVARFDVDGLQRALDRHPAHACGGGPMVAVMRAARLLGADEAAVLNYGDSGDVSGDKSSVVGYLSAACGTRSMAERPAP
jgi:AmmeMemoRadiSam system protein B